MDGADENTTGGRIKDEETGGGGTLTAHYTSFETAAELKALRQLM